MKRVVLMIIPTLICGVMIVSSCKKDGVSGNSDLNIYAFGQTTTKSTTLGESEIEDKFLWCSGLNIEWYNGTTGELKLKNPKDISTPNGEGDRYLHVGGEQYVKAYAFYLGDEELFVLGAPNSCMSYSLDFPVLVDAVANGDYNGSFERPILKYYIGRGYPNWDYWTKPDECATPIEFCWQVEREKNWKAIEQGLNKFIEQLKKEGRYRK